MNSVGARIREIRNRFGLSQEKFAEKLNTYRIRINKIENDRIDPTFNEILNICNNFNTDIEYFIVSKPLFSHEFKIIAERYINNQSLSDDEKRNVIEGLYIGVSKNHLKRIYEDNVTNNYNYLKYDNKSNKIDIEEFK